MGEGVLASLTLSLGVFRRPPSCCRMLLFRWGLAFIWPFVPLGFGPRVRLVVTLFFAVWASSCCRLVVPVWPFYMALLFLEGAWLGPLGRFLSPGPFPCGPFLGLALALDWGLAVPRPFRRLGFCLTLSLSGFVDGLWFG